jgi:hypothetical protein
MFINNIKSTKKFQEFVSLIKPFFFGELIRVYKLKYISIVAHLVTTKISNVNLYVTIHLHCHPKLEYEYS